MGTRFIESFDSVRFNNSEEYLRRQTHATIELLLSLLFGEPMILPEPYSFDSLGFLRVGPDLLTKRPNLGRSSPVRNPFVLSLRPAHTSYREMVSDLMRQKHFTLSSWPEINNLHEERSILADFIAQGKFKEAMKNFDSEKVERLEYLDAYFSSTPSRQAGSPRVTMAQYVMRFLQEETDQEKILSSVSVDSLQEGLKTLRSANVAFTNRSEVREKGKSLLGEEVFHGVVEFIDSCYSHVVSSSIAADTCIFTSIERPDTQLVIEAEDSVERLTSLEQSGDSVDHLNIWINSEPELLNKFSGITSKWDSIWEILEDEEWRKSVTSLHTALNASGNDIRTQAEDAFCKHIDLLSGHLSTLIFKKKGNMVSAVGSVIGAVAGEVAAKVLEYQFGISLPTGSGGGLGALAPYPVTQGLKKVQNFWSTGSIRRNIWRTTELR